LSNYNKNLLAITRHQIDEVDAALNKMKRHKANSIRLWKQNESLNSTLEQLYLLVSAVAEMI